MIDRMLRVCKLDIISTGIKLQLQQGYTYCMNGRLWSDCPLHLSALALCDRQLFFTSLQYCTQREAIFTSVIFSLMCESLLPLISCVCGECPPKDKSDNPKTNYAWHIILKEAMAHH